MPDAKKELQAKEQKEWVKSGGEFLTAAQTLANASGAAAPIVHNAWQAAENSLKALSVGHGYTPPKTHDFSKITSHLVRSNVLSSSEVMQLASDMTIVSGSRNYSDTKYPSSNAIYWDTLPRQDITNVLFATERIQNFVLQKIGSPQTGSWNWDQKSASREHKSQSPD